MIDIKEIRAVDTEVADAIELELKEAKRAFGADSI